MPFDEKLAAVATDPDGTAHELTRRGLFTARRPAVRPPLRRRNARFAQGGGRLLVAHDHLVQCILIA